jgi:hypothetical protein
MSRTRTNTHSAPWRTVVLVVAGMASGLLGLYAPTSASAAFDQVGCFGGTGESQCGKVSEEKFGEEVQLGGVASLAVNRTGQGGVPAGTIYAARHADGKVAVAMYVPKAGGGLEFAETWVVTQQEEPYERCGPLLGTKEEGGKVVPLQPCASVPQAGALEVGVSVNQATGDVYVVNGTISPPTPIVAVFAPDGSAVISRFGVQVGESSTVAETPEDVHRSIAPSGIAVDAEGTVYLFDGNFSTFYSRLMVFKPTAPGVFATYAYAGEVLARAGSAAGYPTIPLIDNAGDLYVLTHGEKRVEEFAPQTPAAYPAPAAQPLCSFEFPPGGILSMTVDPASGEVFYFSYKQPKAVRRLGTCNQSTGKFTEIEPSPVFPEAIKPSPERGDLYALAFDPARALSPGRPPGVLYGAAAGPIPENGVGKGEPGQSSLGYIFAHPEESPPEVEGEVVDHVTASTANLRALVNAKGFVTRFVFQYLTVAQYEANPSGDRFADASEAPLGGGEIPAAAGARGVAANVAGLTPDTPYRFRVLVSSLCSPGEPAKVCEAVGPESKFRTYPEELRGLPDGRSWELVSPAQKNGGQVYPADPGNASCEDCKPGSNAGRFPMQSAPDGEEVAYEGSPFGEGAGAEANSYVSHRTASGWQTSFPTPSNFRGRSGEGYLAFSTDLAEGLIDQTQRSLAPNAPAEYPNLYSQTASSPDTLRALLSAAPTGRTSRELSIRYAGASTDLSRVFFEANVALTPEVPSVAPAAPSVGLEEYDLYEWSVAADQIRLVNVAPGNLTAIGGASFVGSGSAYGISADGSRAYFEDGAGHVYQRTSADETISFSVPGSFLSASTDGTKALLKDGCLYDMVSASCVDLTEGSSGFIGLVGQSSDLSHVYFVDSAVLPGAEDNSLGESGQSGGNNLYLWTASATRFIVTLDAHDGGGAKGFERPVADWEPEPAFRTAEASPSGRYLAFMSLGSLTGQALCRGGSGADEFTQVACSEDFLYDAQTGSLSCPSCNPSEAAPLGASILPRELGPPTLPQARYLLDDGRLYFDSQDSLLPTDTNQGVEDVYEFEPPGTGSCSKTTGCVGRLSAGNGGVDSNFAAADDSGRNVFFTSRDRLVKTDGDEQVDLYDAREGGGFVETELPNACQGEACQPPVVSPPSGTLPGTTGFQGTGNVDEKSRICKKGKVRRNGQCVKKPKKARRAKHHHAKLGKKHRRPNADMKGVAR